MVDRPYINASAVTKSQELVRGGMTLSEALDHTGISRDALMSRVSDHERLVLHTLDLVHREEQRNADRNAQMLKNCSKPISSVRQNLLERAMKNEVTK